MTIDNAEAKSIPGIPNSVSNLVKDEAVRWREAASANHWAVFDLPVRGIPQGQSPRLSTALRARGQGSRLGTEIHGVRHS